MLQLAAKLKRARLSANFSVTAAAGKIGTRRSTYQYWEEKGPPLDKIPDITKAFGLPDNYFFVNDPAQYEKIELPKGDLKVTLKDHFDLIKEKDRIRDDHEATLKEYNKIMKRLIEAHLLRDVSSAESQKPSQSVEEQPDEHSDLLLSPTFGGKLEAPGHQSEPGNIHSGDKLNKESDKKS